MSRRCDDYPEIPGRPAPIGSTDSRAVQAFADGSCLLRIGDQVVHLNPADLEYLRAHPLVRMGEERTLLTEAREIIYGDREGTHGEPDRNLRAIGGIWTAVLRDKLQPGVEISPELVCLLMVGLKLARAAHQPRHREHALDAVGYLALMERCGFIDPAQSP